jgi:predicted oxidoreductase
MEVLDDLRAFCGLLIVEVSLSRIVGRDKSEVAKLSWMKTISFDLPESVRVKKRTTHSGLRVPQRLSDF